MREKQLVEGLRRVTAAVQHLLPERDIEFVQELLDVGEWGVAHEHICTQLFEYDATVPPEVVAELARLGEAMRLDPEAWLCLRSG